MKFILRFVSQNVHVLEHEEKNHPNLMFLGKSKILELLSLNFLPSVKIDSTATLQSAALGAKCSVINALNSRNMLTQLIANPALAHTSCSIA